MTTRKLTLRREALIELTTDELAGVVAGEAPDNTKSCPDYTYTCLISGCFVCTDTRSVLCP